MDIQKVNQSAKLPFKLVFQNKNCKNLWNEFKETGSVNSYLKFYNEREKLYNQMFNRSKDGGMEM